MIEEIRDIISRRNISEDVNDININIKRVEVPDNIKQIRCPTCHHIHVFLNLDEVTCCNIIYYRIK